MDSFQEVKALVSTFVDCSGFIRDFKFFGVFMSKSAKDLFCTLLHFFLVLDPMGDRFTYKTGEDGRKWLQMSSADMCKYSEIAIATLYRCIDELTKMGLVSTSVETIKGSKQPLYWALNYKTFERFILMATYFVGVAGMFPSKIGRKRWVDFYVQHPEIVNEFKGYVKDFESYIPTEEEKRIALATLGEAPGRQEIEKRDFEDADASNSTKRKVTTFKTPVKKKNTKKSGMSVPDAKPDRFVEYWNTLPDVPKCKLGSKNYEIARSFFKAHQRYEAGECKGFMLDSDEYKRLELRSLNGIPSNAQRRGPKKIPMRSDEEMFQHIGKAALVYQKEYMPLDKKKLPKTLPVFLYNTHSKKYGTTSMFLEKLSSWEPVSLDDSTYDALWDKGDEAVHNTYHLLAGIWNRHNHMEENDFLPLKEHKTLLQICESWVQFYFKAVESDPEHVYFGSYADFREWMGSVIEDYCWDDMPITAFRIGSTLWRKLMALFWGGDLSGKYVG